MPLLGNENQSVLTSNVTPTDQGLDENSELDTQLERGARLHSVSRLAASTDLLGLSSRYRRLAMSAYRDSGCLYHHGHSVRERANNIGSQDMLNQNNAMSSGKVRFSSRTIAEIFRVEEAQDHWESVDTLPQGCSGMLEGGKEMRKEDYPLWKTVNRKEVIRGLEFRIRRGDGSHGSIRSTSSPIFDSNGEVVAYVAVIEDVTTGYDARMERDALLAEHDAVAKANRLKDDFISTLSHELRTVSLAA